VESHVNNRGPRDTEYWFPDDLKHLLDNLVEGADSYQLDREFKSKDLTPLVVVYEAAKAYQDGMRDPPSFGHSTYDAWRDFDNAVQEFVDFYLNRPWSNIYEENFLSLIPFLERGSVTPKTKTEETILFAEYKICPELVTTLGSAFGWAAMIELFVSLIVIVVLWFCKVLKFVDEGATLRQMLAETVYEPGKQMLAETVYEELGVEGGDGKKPKDVEMVPPRETKDAMPLSQIE